MVGLEGGMGSRLAQFLGHMGRHTAPGRPGKDPLKHRGQDPTGRTALSQMASPP